MTQMQIYIQESINKELKIIMLKQGYHNLQDTVNFILGKYFKIKVKPRYEGYITKQKGG